MKSRMTCKLTEDILKCPAPKFTSMQDLKLNATDDDWNNIRQAAIMEINTNGGICSYLFGQSALQILCEIMHPKPIKEERKAKLEKIMKMK